MSRAKPAGDRIANDAYYTDPGDAKLCVAALPELGPGLLVDPCVGGGAFTEQLRRRWPDRHVFGVDIDRTAGGRKFCSRFDVDDFRTWKVWTPEPIAAVVSNPPFNMFEEFVERSLELAPVVGMLLRINALGGQDRRAWWVKHRFAVKHIMPDRPSFSGMKGTDATEYAFFVWIKGEYIGATEWLPNRTDK